MITPRTFFLTALFSLQAGAALLVPVALGQTQAKPYEPPPFRDLPNDRAYELRVLYAENTRLPTLSRDMRQTLYGKIEQLLEKWYSYRVKIREIRREDLREHFANREFLFTRFHSYLDKTTIDLSSPQGNERLRIAIAKEFQRRELPLIERYLQTEGLRSKEAAIEITMQTFGQRLAEFRGITMADGRPFFDPADAAQNSYAHWALSVVNLQQADLVFTNTMIAGADMQMPLYVIARGGITTAFVDNNERNPFQVAGMVGLFPFLSDAPVFLRERGRIPPQELLDVIATFCMHEMGHFFLRYKEHYDHPHCIHVAPSGLNYYEWHKAIHSGGPCLLPHQKATRF